MDLKKEIDKQEGNEYLALKLALSPQSLLHGTKTLTNGDLINSLTKMENPENQSRPIQVRELLRPIFANLPSSPPGSPKKDKFEKSNE